MQLLDSKPDLKQKGVPRLVELHVVSVALGALGASMENSGVYDAWVEADHVWSMHDKANPEMHTLQASSPYPHLLNEMAQE